jgi:major membrane immunogen (membrane-anchored lipoprotein)
MKKKIIIALVGLAMLCTGCTKQTESEMYIASGHYYAGGEIVTEDGNIWGYTSEIFDDSFPVYVLFDNNGTESIYDDIIVGIVNK